MQCRVCGFEFDENQISNRGCLGCGKYGCNAIHCPNCGFPNYPKGDHEFTFINNFKNKINFFKD